MKEKAQQVDQIMSEVAPGYTVWGLTIFLLVAKNGKMSVKAICDEIQSNQATVLRYATEMTDWETSDDKGPGLLAIEEAGLLKKNIVLTEKGQEVKNRIQGITAH